VVGRDPRERASGVDRVGPPGGVTLALEEVVKRYGSGPQAVDAVNGITLKVSSGEFVSIMGPSGCGKSTLLNIIAGIDTPTSGRVTLAGHALATLSDDERSDIRLETIGFVFQSFNLFPTFTVEENVAWPLEFIGMRWRDARNRAGEALDRVGVAAGARARRPAELSGGEQQRVAIARALVTEPMLLLADEPTGNLDSSTGQAVLDLLRGLNHERQLTVVMVTHNTFAATYGHRTVELRDGRVTREFGIEPEPGRVVPLRPGGA
jgi:putative ABC transport system ATP-binding protein